MSTTISDVANKANTSVATVSRYLNGTDRVSESLGKAIEVAIKELDYKPQRTRSQKASRAIGAIFPDLDNLYYIPVLRGLEHRLAERNYGLLISSSEENIETEQRVLNNFSQKGVDGIILLGTRPISGSNQHIISLSKQVPTITINDQILGSSIHSITVDEADGAYKAVDYLIQLGHRKIAFVNGRLDYTTYRYKYVGYEKALHDNEIPIIPEYHVLKDPHEVGGYNGASELFDLKDPPTAIFSANDQMAIGVMKAAFERKMNIPSDLSLVGFSNTPISTAVYPELTTVNQYPYETGQTAADLILELIKNRPGVQQVRTIGTDLVIRGSCGQINSE